MIRIAFAVAALLGTFDAQAGTVPTVYDYDLDFSSRAQGTWGAGNAATKTGSRTLALSLAGGDRHGGIIGGLRKDLVPNPVRPIWVACSKWASSRVCGDPPPRRIEITTDTRNGISLDLRSQGQIGVRWAYEMGTGSIDADAGYGLSIRVPGSDEIGEDGLVSLQPTLTRRGTVLAASGPRFDADLNLVLDLTIEQRGTRCLTGLGCIEGIWTPLAWTGPQDIELLAIDPGGITYLDGVIPSEEIELLPGVSVGGRIRTPLLDLSATLIADQFGGYELSTNAGTFGNTVGGELRDLATIAFELPFSAEARGIGRRLELASDVVTLMVDVDSLLPVGKGGMIVALGKDNKGPFKFSASLDAYDISIGPVLSFVQTLDLTDELWVSLDFDRWVRAEDEGVWRTTWSGPITGMPRFEISDDTTVVTPTFELMARLRNRTNLKLGLQAGVELGKAGISMRLGSGLKLLDGELGPLVRIPLEELSPDDLLDLPVHDVAFPLGGFSPIEGTRFVIER